MMKPKWAMMAWSALARLPLSLRSRYGLIQFLYNDAYLNLHLQGVAGLTKRDIQLVVDGGYNTVESVAYTPRRILEQIKGISEQKAAKILGEGESLA